MSNPLDFEMKANNDFTVRMTVTDIDGALVDLTGFTIKWKAFKPNTTTAAITKTTSSGIAIRNQTTHKGEFDIDLDAADTVNLPAGDYLHEAVTTDAGGAAVTLTSGETKLAAGTLTLVQQFTVQ